MRSRVRSTRERLPRDDARRPAPRVLVHPLAPVVLVATRVVTCLVCRLQFEEDPDATVRCIATHAVGSCCHYGSLALFDDNRYPVGARADCEIVSLYAPEGDEDDWSYQWLPAERSKEAGVCQCFAGVATVRRVKSKGRTWVVLHCTSCRDTRCVEVAR